MKIILDLDTGIDDALALALALARPDCELVGVTCTYGNIDVASAAANTQGLLALFGREDVPVVAGAAGPLSGAAYERKRGSLVFHGENGVGGVELPAPACKGPAGEKPVGAADGMPGAGANAAAAFLVDAARRWGSELVVVPTGPLTNIAAAVEMDPAAMAGVGRIVFMGGALAVPGNVSPFAEANVSYDPEAANVVLASGADVVMVGLDVTLRTLLTREEVASWARLGPRGAVYAQILDHYLGATEMVSPGAAGCALHDPLSLAVALDPGYVTLVPLCVTCRCDEQQRGRTVLDQAAMGAGSSRGVQVALDVDAERFVGDFVASMRGVLAAGGE